MVDLAERLTACSSRCRADSRTCSGGFGLNSLASRVKSGAAEKLKTVQPF
jgi:hypothetical protein